MSAIFGIIDKSGEKIEPGWIERMKSELNRPDIDRMGIIQKEHAFLGNIQIFNTPESISEVLPCEDHFTGMVILSDSRLDNRANLAHLLDLKHNDLADIHDSGLLMKAYKKWGMDCCPHLRGDFTFGVYDMLKKRLFIARDHFGMRPLYYYNHPRFFTFSSEIRGILALPFVNQEPNVPWILDYLLNVDREEYDTFYMGINALPPGHTLELSHGKLIIRRYWELTMPEPDNRNDDQDIIAEYKELFDLSVKNRLRSAYPVGAELSGGLDSSSIVAVGARHLKCSGQPIHLFSRVLPVGSDVSNGFPVDDETSEIQLVSEFIGNGLLHFVTMENQLISEKIAKSIEIIKAPYNSNYATYNFNVFDFAKQCGVRTILSGHGGDQLVTHPASFVYSNYLKNRNYIDLLKDLRSYGQPQQISWLKALILMREVHTSGPGTGAKRSEIKKIFKFGIHPDFISRHSLKEYYLSKRRSVVLFPNSAAELIGKILSRNLYNRIEVSSLMAAYHGIEFRYPMFDVDLISLYLATPNRLKRRFRYGRYLHRIAMTNQLPPSIQWRTDKHGTINPGLPLIFQSDAPNIHAIVKEIMLRKNSPLLMLFNPEILQRILDVGTGELFEYKSVINKMLQLQYFEKIIAKNVAS